MLVAGGLNKQIRMLHVQTDSLDGLKAAVREKLAANADQSLPWPIPCHRAAATAVLGRWQGYSGVNVGVAS
jgi:hypothetical protein